MIRKIIKIDEERCNGCGMCAAACHEGAIAMIDGKAKLVSESYCDGLGDCLPACPTGAISFESREALPYDAAAVESAKRHISTPCGCPGSHARRIQRNSQEECASGPAAPSELRHWPVQLRLAPVCADFFENADLLLSADCAAYAFGDFHRAFIRGRIPLIGCPKLDPEDAAEKLSAIFRFNAVRSVAVVRMEVPCCGGLERAARRALESSCKSIPLRVITIATDGRILEER